MARLALILNGKKADDASVIAAVRSMRDLGHGIEISVTRGDGDASRMTEAALDRALAGDIDTIVAGGGDGTVNEVFATAANAASPPACSFGILPAGTANDFANGAGLPLADPVSALGIVTDTPARSIDLGGIDERTFVNAATGGFGAQVTVETDPELKRRFGGLAYILTGLARAGELTSHHGTFTGEGFSWSGTFVAMAIANGRLAGGGIPLCPEALLDDGLLDLTVIRAVGADARDDVIGRLLREGLNGIEPIRITARSPWFTYEGDGPLAVNLDGEPMSLPRFEARIRPRHLSVHLGADAPLAR